MKTNYQKINLFEVSIMGMIAVGFVIVGFILFSSLTPRIQTNVDQAFNMFDIHEQVAATISGTADDIGFIFDIPNEFYKQFYVAFTEVAVLPPQVFEIPAQVAAAIARNTTIAVNNLSVQVALGYAEQTQTNYQVPQMIQQATNVAYINPTGKVLGASIDFSPTQADTSWSPASEQSSIIPYGYDPPNLDQIKLSLINLLKQ